MVKTLPIPDQEQLRALTSGLRDVYDLISEYVGDLNKVPNFRQHITVTKSQLAEYLRIHPQLIERHVSKPGDPKYHEFPVLERTGSKYRVYVSFRGEAQDVEEFDDLTEATARYLMWYL